METLTPQTYINLKAHQGETDFRQHVDSEKYIQMCTAACLFGSTLFGLTDGHLED